jgi:hypothetical protein
LQDFSTWSGLNITDFKKAIEGVRPQLEEVEIEGVKGLFLMLREDFKALDSISVNEKAPACLLPKFDSILLGQSQNAHHRRRA